MSDILDQIDDALDDYVEWHGSVDSASWAADGSHEVQIGGHYYATDRPAQHHLVERPMSRGGICGERDIMRIERFEAYLPSRALADLARREQACASLAAIVPRDELPGVTAAIEQAALMMGASFARVAEAVIPIIMSTGQPYIAPPGTPHAITWTYSRRRPDGTQPDCGICGCPAAHHRPAIAAWVEGCCTWGCLCPGYLRRSPSDLQVAWERLKRDITAALAPTLTRLARWMGSGR